ncbi:MAG: hypothetical protein ACXADF_08015 [Candidatus Thorarchaeota archaeon]
MVSRSRVFAGFLILCILFIPILYFRYLDVSETSEERTIYQTPPNGIIVECGQWLYGEAIIPQPPSGFNWMYICDLEIHEWNVLLDEMLFSRNILPVTLEEFLEMNDTERFEAGFGGGQGLERTRSSYTGGKHGLSNEWGTQVWAARFVDRDYNVVSGSFRISLTIKIVTVEVVEE